MGRLSTHPSNYKIKNVSKMSFISLPGHREAFLLPDRSKYVNMEKRFLRSYMDLLVCTCHQRGALATGGMAALLLPTDRESATCRTALATVTRQSHWSNEHACRSATLFSCNFDNHSDSVSLPSVQYVLCQECLLAVLSYVCICFRFLPVCLYTFQIEVAGDRCWC